MKKNIERPFDVNVLNFVSSFLFFLSTFIIISSIAFWYVFTSSINLKKITIYGDFFHHGIASFRTNIIPNLSGNFFTINLNNTQHAFESLPWIQHATIKRVFPNQIEIHLKEYKPVGSWGAREDLKMVNADGAIFDSNTDDDEYDKLPQFIGPEGQSSLMLVAYSKLNTILRPLKVKLAKIELSSRGSWTIMLEGGAQVELGRGSIEIIGERLKQFTDSLSTITANFNKDVNALKYADLRHANGYALKLNGITTVDLGTTNLTVKK